MKRSEGIVILATMSIIFGIWNLYGSIVLLVQFCSNPEFVAGFDQLYIDAGRIFFRIMARVYPLLFLTFIIGAIGALKPNRVCIFLLVVSSLVLLFLEIAVPILEKGWLINAFTTPHISPILYLFNIIFFTRKLKNKT